MCGNLCACRSWYWWHSLLWTDTSGIEARLATTLIILTANSTLTHTMDISELAATCFVTQQSTGSTDYDSNKSKR